MSQDRDFGGGVLELRKWYGGMMPSEVRNLRHLQEENVKLTGLVADLLLRIYRLKSRWACRWATRSVARMTASCAGTAGAPQRTETRAMDFVYGQIATGHKIRMLTIVNAWSQGGGRFPVQLSWEGRGAGTRTVI